MQLPSAPTGAASSSFSGRTSGTSIRRGRRRSCISRGERRSGDWLLLGVDLVKPERDLMLAYDDPLGVTAAFNKNLLLRLNAEAGTNFKLEEFEHEVRWNRSASRVEMHLVSRHRQDVVVPGPSRSLEFTLEPGESIWTESSYMRA